MYVDAVRYCQLARMLSSLCATNSRNKEEALYAKGFFDGYLNLPHDDGIHPAHRFQVCIPLIQNTYRLGYLDGLTHRAAN